MNESKNLRDKIIITNVTRYIKISFHHFAVRTVLDQNLRPKDDRGALHEQGK